MGKPTGLAKEQDRALDLLKPIPDLGVFHLPSGSVPHGVAVAGLRDLAAMKLSTIAGRGLRRDFWDLHEISSRAVPLRDAGDAYVQLFGVARADLYHVMRSLTWFEDAEKDPSFPVGLTVKHWTEIKAWFRREAPALLSPS